MAVQRNAQAWAAIEDHRGTTVYDKNSGNATILKGLGPVPQQYTTQPPEANQKWNSQKNAWVDDPVAIQQTFIQQAQATLAGARHYVSDNYTMLNEPTPQPWVDHLRALMAIVSGQDTTTRDLPQPPS